MGQILELLNNFPLVMAASAWLAAQLTKLVLTLIFSRDKFSISILLSSGGMPSSHSATVCALASAFALTEGLGSAAFAISAILSFVVMYDARGVRRSAGEQAQMLNSIINHISYGDDDFFQDTQVNEIMGHTPLQVAIGAGIGILLPIIIKLVFLA